jgi:hypothetical protein
LFGLASSLALIIREKTFPPSADPVPHGRRKIFSPASGKFFTIPKHKLQPIFAWYNDISMLDPRAVYPI